MPLAVLDPAGSALIALAGLGAGVVNGAAGGGSLLSFPVLLATGYSPLVANVTSTVGILPGSFGGVVGFRREVDTQRERLRTLLGTVVVGSIAGGVLLLTTPARYFSRVVPYLILLAVVAFAVQPLLGRVLRAPGRRPSRRHRLALHAGTFGAAAYGAYFGAGLGIVLLAVLGATLPDSLVRLLGLRVALALIVNGVAALVFVVSAPIAWVPVALMAGSSLVGGYLGARLAKVIPTALLRALVIAFGLATAASLLAS